MTSHMFGWGRAISAAVALAMIIGVSARAAEAPAKEPTQDYQGIFLRLQKLSAEDAARLNEKAKAEYELGLASIDKVNYTGAMQRFNKAVDEQPDNLLLRYVAVQMAMYLGNTRKGKAAVEYFDTALTHLNVMNAAPQLNSRERERVTKYIDQIGKLRDAVNQRDMMRNKYGRELAKQWATYFYQDKEKGDNKDKTPEQIALERTGMLPAAPGSTGEAASKSKRPDISSFYKRNPRTGTLRRGTDMGSKIGPSQAAPEDSSAPSITGAPNSGSLPLAK